MDRYQSVCPADSPYYEVDHKIANNILSIKLPKDRRPVQPEENGKAIEPTSVIDATCSDKYNKKCKKSCTKVKVVHDQKRLRKKPEEELLLLKSIRQITPSDDIKYNLEVELKSPRNYTPLPKFGLPPIIIPEEPVVEKARFNNHEAKTK